MTLTQLFNEAYVSKEQMKEIRNRIKKEFPTSKGWKFSVRMKDYSSIYITILKAPFDFFDYYDAKKGSESVEQKRKLGYMQVNHYYIDDYWKDPAKKVLKKILKIVQDVMGGEERGKYYDAMTDLMDFNYYLTIRIGDYDKPFEVSKK